MAQNGKEKPSLYKANSALSTISESIEICKWKNDARTCINFSFDDNNHTHRKISQILDQYGYKGSFFEIASYMNIDSLKDISSRGHEIGNHTFTHADLKSNSIDSTEIDFEIRMSKELIENMLGIKCLSFSDPLHSYSPQSKKIVFKYHNFDRDYSEYFNHDFYELTSTSTINEVISFIENKINNREIILLSGHGIDGEGYESTTQSFLIQTLNLVKGYEQNNDLWVTTLKEGVLYENLYNELALEKEISEDTVYLHFKNFNKNKYRDTEKSSISVAVPYSVDVDLKCLTDSAEIKKFSDKYVITTDLKRDTSLILVIKSLGPTTDYSLNKSNTEFSVSPNPAIDFLNISGEQNITSVEIYDLKGQLILNQTNNNKKINVSSLKKGCYLLKIKQETGNVGYVTRIKFLKK